MAYLNKNINAVPVFTVDANGNQAKASMTVDASLSGTISASGTTASVAFVATSRQEVINASAATLWARWDGVPTVNGVGSFPILSGGSYAQSNVSGTLQLLSTAAGQPFTVHRFV